MVSSLDKTLISFIKIYLFHDEEKNILEDYPVNKSTRIEDLDDA